MNEPKLRFSEFKGEWEEKTLGEECEITAGGDIPKEKISKEKTEIYKVPIISNGIGNNAIYGYTDSPKITQAAITISARGTIGYAEYREYPYYPIVRLLSVFPKDSTSLNTKYLSYILSIQKYDVTNAGIPQLTVPMIGSVIFHIPPSPAEQQKIASCLSAMDDLIAAQAEKVEALKEKKTGLMQQLFPQPGETTPRLRFPEFKGEWEVKNLGEVCDSILVGFPFKREDITDDASGHPILRAFSIGEGIIRHGKDYDKYYPYDAEKLKKYEVRKGDIVISMDGSVGKNIAMVSEKEERNLLIQRVARLRITNYPIHLIFQQIISQRFKDYAAGEKKGAVIAHISQKQIELFPIYVPDSPAEQEKIASCLSTLDDQIAAETEKLTALKDYKKGLMQQLFPQPAK